MHMFRHRVFLHLYFGIFIDKNNCDNLIPVLLFKVSSRYWHPLGISLLAKFLIFL